MPRAPKSVTVAEKNHREKETAHKDSDTKALVTSKEEVFDKKSASVQDPTPVKKSAPGKTRSPARKAAPLSDLQKRPVKNTPAWDSWNRRHTVTLTDAICIVHNIVANQKTLEKLQSNRDPRTKGFNTHLRTLKDWVRNAPDVLPVEEKPEEKVVTGSTRILLAPFIQWVKETSPFPALEIPPEFFDLNPPTPRTYQAKVTFEAQSISKEKSVVAAHAEKFEEPQHEAWAKLLIALAMKHYGLVPKFPAKDLMATSRGKKDDGLYAPLSRYCTEVGIARMTTSDTVRKAFESALTLLGKKFVERIEQQAQRKERTTSLKVTAQTSVTDKSNV